MQQILREHLPAFLHQSGGDLPRYVVQELEAAADCGVFGRGVACFLCDGCGRREFVPFSCKRRGFCPCCCGRRMNDIALHLCDRVLPDIHYRQWVLSLPVQLRFLLLRNPAIVGRVLAVFLRVIFGHLRRKAARLGAPGGRTGSVTVLQRFGDGMRINLHIHAILPDGVFSPGEAGEPPRFTRVEAPTKEELARLAATIERRVLRLLRRSGLCPDNADELSLGADDGPLLGWQAASARGRIALGPRAGWRVLRIGEQEVAVPKRGLVADAGGFNLHAGVHVPAGQRERLLSLCRYVLRPPLAMERITRLPDGRIQIALKRPYSNGTRALVFEPMDLLAKLAALVPPPRLHQVRYHGIFAPHCNQRAAVVPAVVPGAEEIPDPAPSAPDPASRRATRAPRHSWAQLLERTFAIDILACACGGRLRFLCWIFNPEALRAIERSLGRAPPQPPPASPIRGSPQEAFPWAQDQAD